MVLMSDSIAEVKRCWLCRSKENLRQVGAVDGTNTRLSVWECDKHEGKDEKFV